MKHGGVDPDEVQHGGVPILQYDQAGHDPRNLGIHTAMNSANTV